VRTPLDELSIARSRRLSLPSPSFTRRTGDELSPPERRSPLRSLPRLPLLSLRFPRLESSLRSRRLPPLSLLRLPLSELRLLLSEPRLLLSEPRLLLSLGALGAGALAGGELGGGELG